MKKDLYRTNSISLCQIITVSHPWFQILQDEINFAPRANFSGHILTFLTIISILPAMMYDMTACDNDSCPIKWFHMDCLNIDSVPDDKWFSPDCQLEQ